jgi:8-oxo-dGTP pyrophosphatase MutT (NUDIX family)
MGSRPALQPPRLLKKRRQVAAVCYRVRKLGIQFLLVQTRDGRWIFPKGGIEPGLTQAQSAALEAVEEAGVHGRMEVMPFARYFRCKQDDVNIGTELGVTAHLCEVSRLERPQESNRNPSWFSAEKAKQRLLRGRTPEFGAELARVVDRAVCRIQRQHGQPNTHRRMHRDALQEVRFEAFEDGRLPRDLKGALVREFLRRRVHHIGASAGIRRPLLRLGSGTHNVTANVTAINSGQIDSGQKASPSKASRRHLL